MIVRLHEIRDSGLEVTGEEHLELVDLATAPEIRGYGPVKYELRLRLTARELIVDGKIWSEIDIECARCGVFFSTTCLNSAFLRVYEVKSGSDEVDISDDLRESILLELPSYPVCSGDCKGLCRQCGSDLNQGECGCATTSGDIRWGDLDKLDL